MDYKAKLQTNNTELANNNIDLQAILNTINTLPEAGGGGTNGGQHTVSVQTDRSGSSIQCFYLSNGQLCFDTVAGIFQFAEQDFLVDSGTYFIVITSEYYNSVPSGWAEWYNNGNGICYFSKLITEDSSYSE